MKFTKARKDELIQEIIGPVMAEKGLSLRSNRNGRWVWEKNMDGIMEEMNLWDREGSLAIQIGLMKLWVWPAIGNKLWETLEHPRTDWTEWDLLDTHTERKAVREHLTGYEGYSDNAL